MSYQGLLQVAHVFVSQSQASVCFVLVPQAGGLQRERQELLVILHTGPQVTQGIKAVPQVAVHPSLLLQPRLRAILQSLQLSFKVLDGFLEVAEVHPGDAHVAVGLGLSQLILQVPGSLELLLEAPESQGVVPQGHVNSSQVPVGPTLPCGVSNVLQYGELLQQKWNYKLSSDQNTLSSLSLPN